MQANVGPSPQPCPLRLCMLEVRSGAHIMSKIGRSLSHLLADIISHLSLNGKAWWELLIGIGTDLLEYNRDDSPDWWLPRPSCLSFTQQLQG